MIITIDGPASAGKGTLASTLAGIYHLAYFDTGMVYRAVGLEMILSVYEIDNAEAAENFAKNLTFPRMIELSKHADFRSLKGGQAATVVSCIPSVRAALLKMQQDFSLNPVFADGTPANGAVYDGRDTGTVVCPQADIKFFITASPEVRAMRRFKEMAAKGMDVTYEDVLKDVNHRDEMATNRKIAPLKPAADAHLLDTSDLSIEQVVEQACKIIESHKESA